MTTRDPKRPAARPPVGPDPADTGDARLSEAFRLARDDAARPAPAPLIERIAADAARALPRAMPARPERASFLATLGAALGGWPGLGGLAAAGMAGLWLGAAPVVEIDALGQWFGGAVELGALLPDDYSAASEG